MTDELIFDIDGKLARVVIMAGGHVTLIDNDDWPVVRDLALYLGGNGYAYFTEWKNGASRARTLHGFLAGRHLGRHVDHIDGEKLDNRRANFRVATYQQNQLNRHRPNKNNSSGARGVYWNAKNGKWIAQIAVNRTVKYLGSFDEIEVAIATRRAAELEHFGEVCP